jgi:toxin secretion/phage lysis holin
MVNYLDVLSNWMQQPHLLLIILIMMYTICGTIDFMVGSFNAAHTPTVTFSSQVAQLGIVRKLVTLAVMILIVPLALMLPMNVGIYSLTILYLGIVGSEMYSILGNVGIIQDADKHKNLIGTLFSTILENIFKAKGVDKLP